MDSCDGMMMPQLLQYEADAATGKVKKFMIISCLLRLKLLIALLNVEISVLGRPRTDTNMGWSVVLDNDYFADQPTHTPKVLRR
jgi:hypothetical protein